ncbi:hypothetical protein DL98DRAFT_522353 [Cadophora sp. DSE1049]|nr:hypothetical protein DL98DRAFT_522353 [Cadophora sp. DSE1049]
MASVTERSSFEDFTALLLATSAMYFGFSAAHVYLSTISKALFFRINSALCLLVFVFTCISLPVAWSKPEALVAATWAIFTSSNVISIRYPVLQLYRRSGSGGRVGLVPSPAMDIDCKPMGFH